MKNKITRLLFPTQELLMRDGGFSGMVVGAAVTFLALKAGNNAAAFVGIAGAATSMAVMGEGQTRINEERVGLKKIPESAEVRSHVQNNDQDSKTGKASVIQPTDTLNGELEGRKNELEMLNEIWAIDPYKTVDPEDGTGYNQS